MDAPILLRYELESSRLPRRVIRNPEGVEVGWFEPGRRLSNMIIDWDGSGWEATRTGNRWDIGDLGWVTCRPVASLATLSLRFLAAGPNGSLRLRGSAATAVLQAARALLGRPSWTASGRGDGGAEISVTHRFRKPAEVEFRPGGLDPRLVVTLALIAGEMRSPD